jgi:glycosyltransferase involved in cell wall biosynthesis
LHIFGAMNRGGAEMRTVEMMRSIDRERYRFEFCAASANQGDLDEEIRALGGKVHFVRWSASFPMRFRRLLREGDYDIVHSHVHHSSGLILRLAARAGVLGRIAHYRSTGTVYSYDLKFQSLRRAYHSLMKRWVERYATDILAVSEAAMQTNWGPHWRQDPRCQVIYSGVRSRPAAWESVRAQARQELGIGDEERVCIHIGNATPAKNHFRLVEIFAELTHRLPQSCLLLVGEIPEDFREKMRQQVLQVHGAGRLIFSGVRNDVAGMLAAADLMIFPSLFEGLPGAVLEAAANGVPVLASEIEPVVEIAKYLSVVQPLSLVEPNSRWVERADLLLAGGRSDGFLERADREFMQSPFRLETALKQTAALYEARARAL